MLQILIFAFTKLHKLEFAYFLKGVIRIVEKHNPSLLKILGFYNRLLELEPQLDGLTVKYGKHAISKELSDLRVERHGLLLAITGQIHSVENANLKAHENELRYALPVLKRFFTDILRKNEKDKSERIEQFIRFAKTDTVLNAALKTLGFELYVAELAEITDKMRQKHITRTEEISARPKMNTVERVAMLNESVIRLFQAIELGAIENPDLDFQPLISELNVWISYYHTLVKSRQTRSANKTEMDELEIKKAAAMSDKTSATAL
ncbi:MAG TPA: DUF6261 family protein [Paludibacteraceae bacterium]|nr:DUF6261 family protein [Paludibacteraceae bacterium]HPT44052.1 DUF6261 family protein [Paludibacteraceae bacterium]